MKNKPKLSHKKLVELKIRGKGITTNHHSDNEIIEIFNNRNYYYRIASYRKNFPKDVNRKFIGLDFKALEDMSSIDMHLREFILKLSLDVEHGAKTHLMKFITNDPNEDGYRILNDFKNENNDSYSRAISKMSKNTYLKDMNSKRKNNVPIWVFLEIIDFGTLIKLIEFYCSQNEKKKIRNNTIETYSTLLKFVKNLRNATAHNNVFFINIFHDSLKLKLKKKNVTLISTAANQMGINANSIRYNKINDLVALIYLHKKYSSNELNFKRYNQGKKVIKRMRKNSHLYKTSNDYKRFDEFFYKLVEYLK